MNLDYYNETSNGRVLYVRNSITKYTISDEYIKVFCENFDLDYAKLYMDSSLKRETHGLKRKDNIFDFFEIEVEKEPQKEEVKVPHVVNEEPLKIPFWAKNKPQKEEVKVPHVVKEEPQKEEVKVPHVVKEEPQKFSFISSDNEIHNTTSISTFCKLYELDPSTVYKLVKGKVKSHKGWKLYDPIAIVTSEATSFQEEISQLRLELNTFKEIMQPILTAYLKAEKAKLKERQYD